MLRSEKTKKLYKTKNPNKWNFNEIVRNIKPTHKPIKTFYTELKQYENLGATNETEVRLAFATLLQHYARQNDLTFICEKSLRTSKNTTIYVDGMLTDDAFGLPRGYWEAKDLHDTLATAVRQKFDAGYPKDNILFTTQERAILYQDGQEVMDVSIADPEAFIRVLHAFFGYEQADVANWERAVVEFKDKVPALGKRAAALIENEEATNPRFQEAFTDFHRHCQEAINPNLAKAAVEEMLIQHLLTEEIFSTVFDNRDFTRRNIIAREIENVIDALTWKAYSRRRIPPKTRTLLHCNSTRRCNFYRLLAEATLSQYCLRAVFSRLFHQGRRYTRHRLHTAADR